MQMEYNLEEPIAECSPKKLYTHRNQQQKISTSDFYV